MTNLKKSLNDLFKGVKRLPTWKVFAIVVLFCLMSAITFGGAPIGLALLYMWGDTGVYSGRAKAVTYTKKGVRRAQVNPSNPQTPSQTNMRNFFGSFSSLWRSLTPTQLTGWRNLVMKGTNRLGLVTTYRGKQVYTRLNQFLAIIGVAQIDDAPILGGAIAPESSGVTITTAVGKITPNLTNSAAGFGIIIKASLPLLNGRTQSRVKIIFAQAGSTLISDVAVWAAYIAAWGYTPVTGDDIIVEMQYVNNVSGEPSPNGARGVINVA